MILETKSTMEMDNSAALCGLLDLNGLVEGSSDELSTFMICESVYELPRKIKVLLHKITTGRDPNEGQICLAIHQYSSLYTTKEQNNYDFAASASVYTILGYRRDNPYAVIRATLTETHPIWNVRAGHEHNIVHKWICEKMIICERDCSGKTELVKGEKNGLNKLAEFENMLERLEQAEM